MIDLIRIDRSPLVIATHAPTSAPPSLIAPLLGRSIAERLRNKGAEIALRFDDPSKHPKSYRQTASIQAKIPSRDAPPSDILNVHSASLERSGKLKYSYFGIEQFKKYDIKVINQSNENPRINAKLNNSTIKQ